MKFSQARSTDVDAAVGRQHERQLRDHEREQDEAQAREEDAERRATPSVRPAGPGWVDSNGVELGVGSAVVTPDDPQPGIVCELHRETAADPAQVTVRWPAPDEAEEGNRLAIIYAADMGVDPEGHSGRFTDLTVKPWLPNRMQRKLGPVQRRYDYLGWVLDAEHHNGEEVTVQRIRAERAGLRWALEALRTTLEVQYAIPQYLPGHYHRPPAREG